MNDFLFDRHIIAIYLLMIMKSCSSIEVISHWYIEIEMLMSISRRALDALQAESLAFLRAMTRTRHRDTLIYLDVDLAELAISRWNHYVRRTTI